MKKKSILTLFVQAVISASQGVVVFSDGFETGGTNLVGRTPDMVGAGTAVWVTDGGNSTAAIVDVGGDRVMEFVNAGADSFAVELSGPVVSGQMTCVDFSGTGTYSIWKSRSLSPPLFTGLVRSGVGYGTNVVLETGMVESAAFYKVLHDVVTP